MKLAIVFAIIVASACARMITQEGDNGKKLLDFARNLKGAKVVKAADGSNVLCFHCEEEEDTEEWYTGAVFYQIYPRSFMDANNDGDGDLQGIRMRLKHLKNLGVNGVWLSPIFQSPQKDGGYDISSYVDIDPRYGTMDDMDNLILEAKRLGIRLILDFVPNHTSDQHEWFQKSIKKEHPYDHYYMWVDGKNCKPEEEWDPEMEEVPCDPPNNWLSVFAGSAWEWNWERKQFYLHQFVKEQPDVNFDCHPLRNEFVKILEFWMERGIDGFRVDAINHAYEDPDLRDEALREGGDPNSWSDYHHNYTKDLDASYELVYNWRDVLDRFSLVREVEPKLMMTEAYPLEKDNVFRWYGDKDSGRIGSQMAFNFVLISDLNKDSTAQQFVTEINYWLDNVPEWEHPNWVLGNHDQRRLASRYTPARALAMAFLEMTLPGYAVVYNGEEIGMVDNNAITWEETQDPQACNSNRSVYDQYSRDPARTPFQWDATTNAGFNTGAKPWLPINSNYRELNLAAQLDDPKSTYNVYKNLIKLRREPIFRYGSTKLYAFEDENVLALLRSHHKNHFVTVINLNSANEGVTVDLTKIDAEANNLADAMLIYSTPAYHPPHNRVDEEGHEHSAHEIVSARNFRLGPNDAVIVQLTLPNSAASITVSISLLFLAIVRYFF